MLLSVVDAQPAGVVTAPAQLHAQVTRTTPRRIVHRLRRRLWTKPRHATSEFESVLRHLMADAQDYASVQRVSEQSDHQENQSRPILVV